MIPASGDMSELPPAMQGMRRRRFVDKDGDTFYATGTFRHIRLEWAGASIVFRNEDADRIAALILAVRPEPFSEARITVIPDDAVEAAARWLHDYNCRSALHSGFPADEECYGWMDEARELLEAAAPHLQPDDSCCCGDCGL